MIELNLNLVLIILLSIGLYFIINNSYQGSYKKTVEGFQNNDSSIDGNDPEFKGYKPKLTQNVDDVCQRPIKADCLPYSVDYKPNPNKSPFKEPKDGAENLEGHNFLRAGYHSQVDNVGVNKRNKNTNIRIDPPIPQLGVDPWTQSIINVDWNKDEKVVPLPEIDRNIWNKIT